MLGGFGRTGQQQSNDCAFAAGKINKVPIRISYFLLLMFAYQVFGAYQQTSFHEMYWWVPILYAVLTQVILFSTILCHEFGHGTMAKYLGGEIAQILLWPFGGICFSTRPQGIFDGRTKVKNELKIVVAGPATHFIQAPAWLLVMYLIAGYYHADATGLWKLLIPFNGAAGVLPMEIRQSGSMWIILFWELCVWAVTANVFLFLFNVFFPMYPMDSAKILVCTLQLCNVAARTAAKALVFISVPMSVLLIVYSVFNKGQGGGMMPALSTYMGIMCLIEAHNIWTLMKNRQLHTHYLFELARSDTYYDRNQGAYRINNQAVDDDQVLPRSQQPRSNIAGSYILFEGRGNTLGGQNAGNTGSNPNLPNPRPLIGTEPMENDLAPIDQMNAKKTDRARIVQGVPGDGVNVGRPVPGSSPSESTPSLSSARENSITPGSGGPATDPAAAARSDFLTRVEAQNPRIGGPR